MFYRRFSLVKILVLIGLLSIGCNTKTPTPSPEKLTIGVVSYGEGKVSLDKYNRFKDYIATKTRSIRVDVEPAYNELQAVTQIKRKNWDIVFATPGLAAIAIGKELYVPLFSMESVSRRERSLIIVLNDSPIQNIKDLSNKTVALGEPGSASGYYLPLYDLYGLTLTQVRFAPTPNTALELIKNRTVEAGALSERDFEIHKRQFPNTQFRTIHTSRWVPPGVVVIAPTIEINRQQQIQKIMAEAPADITGDAGYVPDAKVPKYKQFIQLVEKVRPLESAVKNTPAVLIRNQSESK
ncbi:phosphate/phosphite/phosphonate ABC transporter substrate-binding protein [Calothrix rhizosoleniae]|uniref:phosphate/phosphite/phosphonate ABC transporter substrate-binding protein n=1 Tax=Calothrix rhizosoleniae TaxID=888997 RepID=UPI000B499F54|nr:PhnD/SsuA/transferrin family substrate-binding protein [Calothrix rhizosoleniae]